MDPYSGVASNDNENESFINQASYIMGNGSAYDDDDDDVNKPIKSDIYSSSAPDPTIASSAAAGDYPQFEKLGAQKQQQGDIINTNEINDDEDEGFGHSTLGQRMDYTSAEYKDKFFMILWILHFIIMFILLIYQWSNTKLINNKNLLKEANAGFLIIFVCAVLGAVLGFLWTKIIRKYAGKIIKIMLYGNLIFLFVAAFVHFLTFSMLSGIIYLVFAVFFGCYVWSIQRRIPFTQILIDISCQIINQYPSIIVVSLLILIMQIIWILWWSAICVAYMSQSQYSPNNFIVILLLISFYWNLEVFKNIGHTTSCGVAATWFFTQSITHEPTAKSLKRACTTSLGSIAFGSLIVAIISVLRQIIYSIKDKSKHNLIICLLDCLLTCLQKMIEYFNMYAFVHVAIYGTSYIKSAKTAWSLLTSKGIDALINDDLVCYMFHIFIIYILCIYLYLDWICHYLWCINWWYYMCDCWWYNGKNWNRFT